MSLWSKTKRYHFSLSKRTSYLQPKEGGGWVRQRCRVSYVTGASNWYGLYGWERPVILVTGKRRRECFYFFCFLTFIHIPFSPVPLFDLLYYLFSLSLGNDTKWPTSVGVLLNTNSVNQPKEAADKANQCPPKFNETRWILKEYPSDAKRPKTGPLQTS